jgi:Fe-S-cluster containining protein
MIIKPKDLNLSSEKVEKESRRFYTRLKKRTPAGLDTQIKQLHEKVFENINCLQCANCCKTISPVFKERDIKRLASFLKVKAADFIHKYLISDQDGDFVLKSVPCPFLGHDNFCSVYEARPFACRSYPHTDTLPFKKSFELIVKNSAVCPGVYEITKRLEGEHNISK